MPVPRTGMPYPLPLPVYTIGTTMLVLLFTVCCVSGYALSRPVVRLLGVA